MGTKYKQGRRLALVLALVLAFNALSPALAHAGNLSNTYVRLNRMAAATDSSFRVVFTTSASPGTVNQLKIDFGSAWTTASGTVNAAAPSPSSGSCAAETGATALPGTLSVTGSSPAITITGVTSLSAS